MNIPLNNKLLLLGAMLSFYACQRDRLELDRLSTHAEVNTHLMVPVLDAHIVMGDLLQEKDDSTYRIEHYPELGSNDSLIRVYHAIDSLYTLTGKDFLEELPVIKPVTRSHALGLVPRDGYFEDEFKETVEFDSLVNTYFSLGDYNEYNDYNGTGILRKQQFYDLSNKAKPFVLPFQNINNAKFGPGDITAVVTNEFDVPVKFDIVLAENNGGWKELDRFVFTSFIPPGAVDSVTNPAEGFELRNVRSQTFGYFYDNFVIEAFNGSSIDMGKQMEMHFKLKQCKLVSGEVKLRDEEKEYFDSDSSLFFPVEVYKNKKIRYLYVMEGDLNYSMESTFPDPIEMIIDFPDVTKNGEPVTEYVEIQDGNAIPDGIVPLDDYLIDMTSHPDTQYNHIRTDMNYRLVPDPDGWVLFDSSNKVSVTFQNVDSLKFDWARGNFEVDTIVVERKSMDYNLNESFKNYYSGEIIFTDPKVHMWVDNAVGISGRMNLGVEGEGRTGDANSLFNEDPAKYDIVGPVFEEKGSIIHKDIELNKSNSNVVNFLSNLPNRLNYSGTIITNFDMVDDQDSIDNFITHDAVTNVGIEAVLPLDLTMNDLTLRQFYAADIANQLDFGGMNFSAGDDNSGDGTLDELELYFSVRNQFPVDIKIVYMLWDTVPEKDMLLDTLHVSVLKSSNPDKVGKVGRYEFKDYKDHIVIDDEEGLLSNFLNANMISTDVKFNTVDGATRPAKFYTHYTLDMAIMVGVKGTIVNE